MNIHTDVNTSFNFLKPKKYKLTAARKISRELHDTNPTVAGMSRNYSQLFISDGFTVDLGDIAKNQKFAKAARSLFVDGSPLDNGVQNIIYEVIRSGDILLYFTNRVNGSGVNELKIDYLMADRIQTPPKGAVLIDVKTNGTFNVSEDDILVEDGVVIYKGEILGFCISPMGEKDNWLFYPSEYAGSPCAVLYSLPIKYNLASKRNYPLITPGLLTIEIIDSLAKSETLSSMLKSKISMILEYDLDGLAKIKKLIEKAGKTEDEYFQAEVDKLISQINTNDIGALIQKPGIKINMQDVEDKTSQNYEKAVLPFLRQLANLYGVNYAALYADGRAETGTTAKLAYQMANSTMSAVREHFFDLVLRPFIELWCEFNSISAPENIAINSSAYAYTRATEEITALKTAVEAKLMSRAQAISSLGLPPRETIFDIDSNQINIENNGAQL